MYIIDFFHEAPLLASILTLSYLIIWGVFIYMIVKMFMKNNKKQNRL